MNDGTTLGDVLEAGATDTGEVTELTEEYLMMIHGGGTASTPPAQVELQGQIGAEQRMYTVISNILQVVHDTATNAIKKIQ